MSQIDLNPERKPLPKPTKTGPKPKKYMKQVGRVTISWAKKKREYMKAHPPAHEGWWICGICLGRVYQGEEDVDHKQNRSTNPELREDDDNLQIVHQSCNVNKKVGRG